jgi:hypothetical protein
VPVATNRVESDTLAIVSSGPLPRSSNAAPRRALRATAVFAGMLVACAEPRVASPAEAQARVAELCAGLSEADRARPVYFRSSEIVSVRPFIGEHKYIKFTEPELRGAEIHERPAPGTTRQAVASAVRCHMAWREAAGAAPQTDYEDPVAVGTPDVAFSETETTFVVRIAGHDEAQGEEILRRARLLVDASPREPSGR